MAASLAKAPRPALGSTVERDDFVNPATMTNTTVLPGDDTKALTAAVCHDGCAPWISESDCQTGLGRGTDVDYVHTCIDSGKQARGTFFMRRTVSADTLSLHAIAKPAKASQ